MHQHVFNSVTRQWEPLTTAMLRLVPATGAGNPAADSLPVVQPADASDYRVVSNQLPGALVGDRLQTDVLGQPGVARQQAATTSPATITLTTTVRRVSIAARTSNLRYVVGTGSVVANASTSHFIAAGERLDIAVPANGLIGVIRDTAATADGVLEVTEL